MWEMFDSSPSRPPINPIHSENSVMFSNSSDLELPLTKSEPEQRPPSISEIVTFANFSLTDEIITSGQSPQDRQTFDRKEIKALLSWKQRVFSLSTLICIIQTIMLIIMIQEDGYTSRANNPFIGPSAATLVTFGAKQAGLIVHSNQWWRLMSSIMLHAGILHLVPNVIIQLYLGGYLNIIYGWKKWLWIYLVSGAYGQMSSCLFLPTTVGVGSSGALLGLLCSWVVWILFRWKKVPPSFRGERNCQLLMVTLGIVLILGTSIRSTVDFGAHFGGSVQGALWGLILLSSELDRSGLRIGVRVFCAFISLIIFLVSFIYMAAFLRPPNWHDNDDNA